MSSAGAASLPTHEYSPFLNWEDVDPQNYSGGQVWWLARAHDARAHVEDGARDFFVAEDDVSGCLVGVVLPRAQGTYKVIAATLLSDTINPSDAIALIKDQVAAWLASPQDAVTRAGVDRWRRRRSWIIARTNAPLAAAAFLIGGLLGFAVAMFAVSSGLVGWPMVLAGVFIGASAGTFLKFVADRKPSEGASPALAGSWGRFAVVTIAAMIGAGIGSGGVLMLFWN